MRSLTERRDPDFICQPCAEWWGAKIDPKISQAFVHAYCRRCGKMGSVTERENYVITEAGRPQNNICFGCIRRHGGKKHGVDWVYARDGRCDYCGAYRQVVNPVKYQFSSPPVVRLTTRPLHAGRLYD